MEIIGLVSIIYFLLDFEDLHIQRPMNKFVGQNCPDAKFVVTCQRRGQTLSSCLVRAQLAWQELHFLHCPLLSSRDLWP